MHRCVSNNETDYQHSLTLRSSVPNEANEAKEANEACRNSSVLPLARDSGKFFYRPPDKEFRYLRTVIVTAGVRQGLDRSRKAPHVTF